MVDNSYTKKNSFISNILDNACGGIYTFAFTIPNEWHDGRVHTEVHYRFDQPCMGELSRYVQLHGQGVGRSEYRPSDLFSPMPYTDSIHSLHVKVYKNTDKAMLGWLFGTDSPFPSLRAKEFELYEAKESVVLNWIGLDDIDPTLLIYFVRAIQNEQIFSDYRLKYLNDFELSFDETLLASLCLPFYGGEIDFCNGYSMVGYPDIEKILKRKIENISGGTLGKGFGYNRDHEYLLNSGTENIPFEDYYLKLNKDCKDFNLKVFRKALSGYKEYNETQECKELVF